MSSEQLNERDIQILQGLADGQTLSDIAKNLRFAEGTLKNFAQQIRDKLGADTNPNAVAMALRRGIIN